MMSRENDGLAGLAGWLVQVEGQRVCPRIKSILLLRRKRSFSPQTAVDHDTEHFHSVQ